MRLNQVLSLARVPNVPTVWSNCLAAWLVAGGGGHAALGLLLAAASLVYAGGCTLNDAFDADWDRRHRPERLIPSGALTQGAVMRLGLTELAGGTALLIVLSPAHWWLPVLLAACILHYSRWHKQTPWSVVTMAACRWLLWFCAGAAALGTVPHSPAFHTAALAVFIWIVSISVIARGEARSLPGERSPAPFILLLIPLLLLPQMLQADPVRRLLGEIAAGLLLLFVLRGRSAAWGPGQWVTRLLAAIPLLDAALLLALSRDGAVPGWPACAAAAAACAGCSLLSLLLQRRFAAS